MGLLLLYIALALGVSFLCSIMEAVLLSVTPSFVARTEQDDPKLGRRLRKMKEDIDGPLAAILSLNTIAHTVGAAGAGAQAADVFGSAALGVFSAVLTFLILVVSEIIPKTLGALYWKQLSPIVSKMLGATQVSMAPLVWLAKGLTAILARDRKEEGSINREELRALVDLGAREGVIAESESRILRNLFRFAQVQARDIMTPRTVLFTLQRDRTVDEVLDEHREIRFSRIPIFGDNQDDAKGFVLTKDLLLQATRGEGATPLSELERPLATVPESADLHGLFETLVGQHEHVALVVDEYGGTAGLVTQEDLIETLLGLEIVDEHDRVQDMQELARAQWIRRARSLGLIDENQPDPER